MLNKLLEARPAVPLGEQVSRSQFSVPGDQIGGLSLHYPPSKNTAATPIVPSHNKNDLQTLAGHSFSPEVPEGTPGFINLRLPYSTYSLIVKRLKGSCFREAGVIA